MHDFISHEIRQFRYGFGTILASSLSGFIAGAVTVGIFWLIQAKILDTTF